MIAICPSCAASNYCPETAAGLTLCCRRCKTQVSVGDPPPGARPPRWYATPFWLAVCLAELAAAAALAACIALLARSTPPENLPMLGPEITGAGPILPAPGTFVTLSWQTALSSAGGFYRVDGQRLSLTNLPQSPNPREVTGQAEVEDVAVRQKPWPPDILSSAPAPEAQPIVLEFRLRLPEDYELAGTQVTLSAAANLEYPGSAEPGAPLSLLRSRVSREWSLTLATRRQQEALARHLRGRAWLQAGAIVFGLFIPAIAFAAGLLAQRGLSIQCPKCGRITIATYYLGGSKLHISPCPHHGTRPVEARRR